MISQTGGHGDFRLPNELPAAPGAFGYADRIGAAAIADDEDGAQACPLAAGAWGDANQTDGRGRRIVEL
jgi:hypothetical protein